MGPCMVFVFMQFCGPIGPIMFMASDTARPPAAVMRRTPTAKKKPSPISSYPLDGQGGHLLDSNDLKLLDR
jgi:hypothetical protein